MASKALIVKADDFGRGPLVDPWRRFLDVCLQVEIVPSIGIVGADFAKNTGAQYLARYASSAFGVEFWNHSHEHRDIRKLSPTDLRIDTLAAQAAIEDVLGRRPSVYGAPFNFTDEAALSELTSLNEFRGFYFADSLSGSPINIDRKYFITSEIGTQALKPISFPFFSKRYERLELPPTLVMQVHPSYWTDACFVEFSKVLKVMLRDGYEPVTAEWYLSSSQSGSEIASTGDGPPYALGEHEVGAPADRAAFARRATFLRKLGLRSDGGVLPGALLQIGGPPFNWAQGLLNHDENVTAVVVGNERSAEQVGISSGVRGRVASHYFDGKDLPFGDNSQSFVVSENFSSDNPVHLLHECSRVLRGDGLLFLTLGNELQAVSRIALALREKRTREALEEVDRIFATASRRAGLSLWDSAQFWNDEEVAAMAAYGGLHPVLRGSELPYEVPSVLGFPSEWGYLFVRTGPSRSRGEALRARGGSPAELQRLIGAGCLEAATKVLNAGGCKDLNQRSVLVLARHVALARAVSWKEALETLGGPTLGDALVVELERTCEWVDERNWAALAGFYRGSWHTQTTSALVSCWYSLRDGGCDGLDEAVPGFLGHLFTLGVALQDGDWASIAHELRRLAVWAEDRIAVLTHLAGDPSLPAELSAESSSVFSDCESDPIKQTLLVLEGTASGSSC